MLSRFFFSFMFVSVFVVAQPFDPFLNSLQKKYPLDTQFMQWVLKTHKTKLALPSLLEKWGVINQDAAATYNGILNTVVLKPEYTTADTLENGKTKRRVKTVPELQLAEPVIWAVRAGTIFHELSHAEYDWLPKSKEPVDKALLKLLATEFDEYLKQNHRNFSATDRKIARSELFAYFRDETLATIVNSYDEILLQNGYFSSNRTCRNTNAVLNTLAKNPDQDPSQFLLLGNDVDFTQNSLPIVFVKGKDAQISSSHPISSKLKQYLWAQLRLHYAPVRTKAELIKWMNTQPELLKLIAPCRSPIT